MLIITAEFDCEPTRTNHEDHRYVEPPSSFKNSGLYDLREEITTTDNL